MEKDNVFVRSTLDVAFEEDVKIIVAVGEVNRNIFKEIKDRLILKINSYPIKKTILTILLPSLKLKLNF